ncbi:MAG: TerB family tellurite resistance protein [Nitrospirae bacterium]|nr:TerB family tellurite resistance protein [Nitrospirota bacterium]
MVSAVKQFFDKYIKPPSKTADGVSEHSLCIATAALLIEMMRADSDITEAERASISKTIQSKFALSKEETHELMKLAEEEIRQATGYFEFTSLINKGFSHEQKKSVIEHLWEIAFADAALDRHEEHMVRKISGLIHVSHRDFIDSKLRVRKRLLGK